MLFSGEMIDHRHLASLPVAQRIFWCTIEGIVAIALLPGGGLNSLQAASLATGFPFAIVILGMAVCVWMGLRSETCESH